MKKQPTTPDKKDKLDPMNDTQAYSAGNEGEDILEREDDDDEMEEEPLSEDLELPEDDEEYEDDEDD